MFCDFWFVGRIRMGICSAKGAMGAEGYVVLT